MGFRHSVASAIVAILLIFGVAPIGQASQQDSGEITALIVSYEPGVNPIAKNGAPTGSNFLDRAVRSQALGAGLYALKFHSGVSKASAKRLAAMLGRDPRVRFAEPDIQIETAATTGRFLAPAIRTLRAAAAPTSLKVTRPLNQEQPSLPQIRLSWSAPLSTYGGVVIGYRILYSTDGGQTFKTYLKNTQSDNTSALLSANLKAGAKYQFRVRAITSDGVFAKVGSVSSIVKASPRTTPKPPALLQIQRVGSGQVFFVEQGKADRGGYSATSVFYSATATDPDGNQVSANSCNTYRCNFFNLVADVKYSIKLFATNPRGTTDSEAERATNDEFLSYQWQLRGAYGVSAAQSWQYSTGSSSAVVAVMDLGVVDHPEVTPGLTKDEFGGVYGFDFVSDTVSGADGDGWDPDPTDMGGDGDAGVSSWHGTSVAGLIVASHDGTGIAGVAPRSKVLPIRALGTTGGALKDLLAAINWAAGIKVEGASTNRFPAKVINLSLGSIEATNCPQSAQEAIDAAISRGLTVVAAAGNGSRDGSSSFPGNCSGVISVAATSSLGDRASYSNFGESVTISAPGGDSTAVAPEATEAQGMIISTTINGAGDFGYGLSEGTSMAAPIVSGIVAQMYSIRRTLSPSQVRNILINSTRSFAPGGVCATSGGCGTGIINSQVALGRTSSLH